MKIIEQFTEGKSTDAALNEDNIVVTGDFVAVLDGATSFSGLKINGIPNGRFASQTAEQGVRALPADVSASDAVAFLTDHVRRAIEASGVKIDTPESRPASAMLIYSRARREIWRLADSPFMVDGVENQEPIPVVAPWIKLRQLHLTACLAQGMTEKEMLENDPVAPVMRALIPPSLIFINGSDPDYSFSMLNGQKVPENLIQIFPVPDAKEIVLASDGYVKLLGTLAETEAHLQGVLARDPLMIGEYPQVKGKKAGWVSFDDRAYIRFNP